MQKEALHSLSVFTRSPLPPCLPPISVSSFLHTRKDPITGFRDHTKSVLSHLETLNYLHLQRLYFQIRSPSDVPGGHGLWRQHSTHYRLQIATKQEHWGYLNYFPRFSFFLSLKGWPPYGTSSCTSNDYLAHRVKSNALPTCPPSPAATASSWCFSGVGGLWIPGGLCHWNLLTLPTSSTLCSQMTSPESLWPGWNPLGNFLRRPRGESLLLRIPWEILFSLFTGQLISPSNSLWWSHHPPLVLLSLWT